MWQKIEYALHHWHALTEGRQRFYAQKIALFPADLSRYDLLRAARAHGFSLSGLENIIPDHKEVEDIHQKETIEERHRLFVMQQTQGWAEVLNGAAEQGQDSVTLIGPGGLPLLEYLGERFLQSSTSAPFPIPVSLMNALDFESALSEKNDQHLYDPKGYARFEALKGGITFLDYAALTSQQLGQLTTEAIDYGRTAAVSTQRSLSKSTVERT